MLVLQASVRCFTTVGVYDETFTAPLLALRPAVAIKSFRSVNLCCTSRRGGRGGVAVWRSSVVVWQTLIGGCLGVVRVMWSVDLMSVCVGGETNW